MSSSEVRRRRKSEETDSDAPTTRGRRSTRSQTNNDVVSTPAPLTATKSKSRIGASTTKKKSPKSNSGSSSPARNQSSSDDENDHSSSSNNDTHLPSSGWSKKREQLIGLTLDGSFKFTVPEPPTTLDELKKWYSLPNIITMVFFIISFVAALPQFNRTYILIISIFWRLGYNVGIGWMLHRQSETQFITNWVQSVQERPNSLMHKFLSNLIDSTMGSGHNSLKNPSLPPSYSAWMVARFIINVILPNDVVAFCLVGWRYSNFDSGDHCAWDTTLCIPLSVAYILGTCLVVVGLWSKASAHHVIGSYCWFWGDFFFRAEQNLTFDGVFELCPHPMYTVGYSWTYGGALFARSYLVLALALWSHMAQMLFCGFVESPHIEKIYGSDGGAGSKEPGRANIFIVKNFDPFRSSDVALVMIALLYIFTIVIGSFPGGPLDSDMFFIASALLFRILASFIVAYVLVKQDSSGFWTKHFDQLGMSSQDAFDNFKRLFNLLGTLQHLSFLACAWRLFVLPPIEILMSPYFAARIAFALTLIGLSHWSFSSCYETLGDEGWFYGDFFLPPNDESRKLTYTGIYRYINNPDTYLGHLWLYGVALLCSRWEIFAIGLIAQSLNILFLQLVEKPRLKSIYKQNVRPYGSAIGRVIADKTKKVRQIPEKIKEQTTKVKEHAAKLKDKLREKATDAAKGLIRKFSSPAGSEDDESSN